MNLADLELLIKSIIVGFSIAAPVGPIAILCINRTLSEGKQSGFVSGLGAATADILYGGLVAFGVTAISDFLTDNQMYVRLIGGLVLIVLGLRTFLSKPSAHIAVVTTQSLIRDYISTLFLTLSNPLTIFAFFAAFTAFNLQSIETDVFSPYIIMAGIFTGSLIWWSILTQFVGFFQKMITAQKMKHINIFSGILITLFGLVVLIELVLKFGKY